MLTITQKNKKSKAFLAGLIIFLIISIPLFGKDIAVENGILIYKLYSSTFIFISIVFICSSFSLIHFFKLKQVDLRLDFLDVLVFGYIVYLLIISILKKEFGDSTIYFITGWLSVLAIRRIVFYIEFDIIDVFCISILCASFLVSVYGIFQYSNILVSWNSNFKISGTFHNPGIYGIRLAICFPISLYCLDVFRNKLYRGFVITVLILIGTSVILSESRTACFTVMLVSTLWILYKVRILKRQIYLINYKYLLILAVLLVALFLIILIAINTDSLQGRLLIWRVSSNMISDSPYTGHGIGKFDNIFGCYMANYTLAISNEEAIQNAENIGFAFNDYLQILVEQGIFGALFFFSIIFYSLKYNYKASSHYMHLSI